MVFHKQGAKRNCGQIAVAALTERTVEEIEKLIGHSHGTKTRELAAALRTLGFTCGERCRPLSHFGYEVPKLCLAQLHQTGRAGWHWVAIGNGYVYDGNENGAVPLAYYTRIPDPRLTSFLRVNKPGVLFGGKRE